MIALLLLFAAADVRETLKAVENRYNRVRTLTVDFEQTWSGQGKGLRTEAGTLSLHKPGRMRWEYSQPAGKLFVSDGKFVWLYSPSARRVEKAKVKESDDLRAPLGFLLGRLDFDRDFREFRGDGETITAIPKSPKAPYREVRFQAASGGLLTEVVVTGHDATVMTFQFRNERVNPALSPAIFQFTPPQGVPVVEAGERQ